MLKIFRRLWKLFHSKKKSSSYERTKGKYEVPLKPGLKDNLHYLKEAFGPSNDLIIREIEVKGQKLALVYLESMIDRDVIQRDILPSLMRLPGDQVALNEINLPKLMRESLPIGNLKEHSSWQGVFYGLLDGQVALLMDGYSLALLLGADSWEKRAVTEPEIETVIRGPREGFTEDLPTNISLIRRRLRTPNLRFETFYLGRTTRTRVVLSYLEGLALEGVLKELRSRLKRIDVDGILESGYIEELIEDSPFSPFPQMARTERPDRVVADILQGRVAILTDGSPFALILPVNLFTELQAPDDLYERWVVSFIRIFRFLALFIALLLPSLYVAVTTFHHEMIPTTLAVAIAAQRERVPYPAFVEALLMQIIFEILVEAGVRLPRPVGQAVTIVGALVIGEAAIRAGLASAAMVIVVSLTAISSFTNPTFGLGTAIRMLRLPMIFLAGSLGLFGIFTGILAILIHLVTLRSFGLPYLAPLAPFIWEDQKDVVFRAPWWAMLSRPKLEGGLRNFFRVKPGIKKPEPAEFEPPEAEIEAMMKKQKPAQDKKDSRRPGR
ncbi:spore germination protein KA [Thermanaeromonas toyohensis ToBE]|uniref:Spore germination protein KA n=1 Tax=Thermanaeromonas toyohensis ToBE TaxID=698762 RepID=A0A1W1VGF2_9FIRM|nr:spore germination protein [Thermanaeromonas toyohensis]SMB92303.1 spore germination protein KA [Thermanaeromonas toyohensis ToBE]